MRAVVVAACLAGGFTLASASRADGPELVHVSVVSDSPASLVEAARGPDAARAVVCTGSCEITLDRSSALRVSGTELYPSRRYTLPASGDAFTLTIHAASTERRAAATDLLVGGLILTAGFGVALGISATDGADTGTAGLCGALVAVGVALVGGSFVLARQAEARVTVEPTAPRPPPSVRFTRNGFAF